jgi:glycosyltransferase involved in cell wall biosynthesis
MPKELACSTTGRGIPVNIGIVVPGFSASESDWCIPALLSLVRDLGKSHRVRVFALRYPNRRACYPIYASTVESFGGADVRGLARLPLLMRAIAAIRREHGREPFDVLHAFWADEPGFVAVGRPAPRVSSVVTLLGASWCRFRIDTAARSRLNRFLAASALAGSERDRGIDHSRLSRAASRDAFASSIGVDLERFSRERLRLRFSRKDAAAHVASLVPVKDQRTLLQAFARVSRAVPDAALNVVGSGPLENGSKASRRARVEEGSCSTAPWPPRATFLLPLADLAV